MVSLFNGYEDSVCEHENILKGMGVMLMQQDEGI